MSRRFALVVAGSKLTWDRLPDVPHGPSRRRRRRHGQAQIRKLLTAIANFRSGQTSRLLPTRANGQPAYGMYRVNPTSGLAHPTGLLLLSLTDGRIAALT